LYKEWFERTVANGASWYDTPIKQQSASVLNMLQRQKVVMAPAMKAHDDYHSKEWPALALQDGEAIKNREMERTHEIVYAGGVVFNTWMFDASRISVPYLSIPKRG
jgi:hypothetical protein